MKKAINLYFLDNVDTKEKLDNIKSAGFDGVLLGICTNKETMTLQEQIEYCRQIGLGVSMVHCSYYEPNLYELWQENSAIGDETEKDLINQIEQIKTLTGNNFVIHTHGGKDAKTSSYGLKRITNILKKCEEYNINLCIENLYLEEQVDYIFNNLQSPNLKVCYDSGHDNCLTPGSHILKNYASLITATHIHDNHGNHDEHIPLGKGNIDIENLAQHLSLHNLEYLTAEVKHNNDTRSQKEILKENFEALQKLEEKIAAFRHKQN